MKQKTRRIKGHSHQGYSAGACPAVSVAAHGTVDVAQSAKKIVLAAKDLMGILIIVCPRFKS